MSNKNISQSITEAWAKSVATGMVQSQKKEQKRQQLDETSATLHNKAVQHILENDKGFYRPDTDPFFRKVDGDLLRRQRLAEQEAPMPPEAGPALDDETKERRKRYETAFEGPITGREQGKIDSEMEAIKKKEQEEIAKRDAQAQTGINPDSERYRGRENEAGLRGDPDFDPTAPGSQREVRAAQVRDALAGVRGPKYGDRLSSENTGTRGSIQVGERPSGGAFGPAKKREDLTGEAKETYERTVAARLERDKDKIAAGDMDAEGRMTAQGQAKRDASIARADARRAAAKARNEKARDEADAARNERLARREARKAGKPYTRPGAEKPKKPEEKTDDRTFLQKTGDVLGVGGDRTTGEDVAGVGNIGRTVLGGPGQVAIPPGVPEVIGAGVDALQGLMNMGGKDQKQTPPATTQTDTNLQSSEATQAALKKRMEDARKRADA